MFHTSPYSIVRFSIPACDPQREGILLSINWEGGYIQCVCAAGYMEYSAEGEGARFTYNIPTKLRKKHKDKYNKYIVCIIDNFF